MKSLGLILVGMAMALLFLRTNKDEALVKGTRNLSSVLAPLAHPETKPSTSPVAQELEEESTSATASVEFRADEALKQFSEIEESNLLEKKRAVSTLLVNIDDSHARDLDELVAREVKILDQKFNEFDVSTLRPYLKNLLLLYKELHDRKLQSGASERAFAQIETPPLVQLVNLNEISKELIPSSRSEETSPLQPTPENED